MMDIRQIIEMLRRWGGGSPQMGTRRVTPDMIGPTQVEMTEAPFGGSMVDPESVQEKPRDVLGGLAQVAQIQQAMQPPPQQSAPPMQGMAADFEPFGESLLKSRRRGMGGLYS